VTVPEIPPVTMDCADSDKLKQRQQTRHKSEALRNFLLVMFSFPLLKLKNRFRFRT
jgi:hypothetical protein